MDIRPLTKREQLEAYLQVLYAYREFVDSKINRAENELSLELKKEKD